jgi:acylphosphatase
MTIMIRLTAYVSGRVQRVGYRSKVVSLAKEMSLVGFVQNRPDGRALVIAEGEKQEDLEGFASAIQIKNALINVESISAEYSQGSGEYSIFRKITGPEEVGERLDDGIEILKDLVVGVNNLAVGLNNLTTITKEGFENLGGKMDQMLDKQDQALGKMDQMLDKQDQALGKMDQTLDKQDHTILILSGVDKKMDKMLDKQDQMLDKQDETTEAVRDLKRDDERFVRMEKDIRTIKGKLGIR